MGHVAAALSFLLVGAGLQTTQTAGLALATDLAPVDTRPRVVALMYVMLLVGMVGGGAVFGLLLADFTPTRLVQVVQGAAMATVAFNAWAVWKQEARDPTRRYRAERRSARTSARAGRASSRSRARAASCGPWAWAPLAFNMQDVVLEPYGGEILKLSVGATSALTALMAAGALVAFALAARWLGARWRPLPRGRQSAPSWACLPSRR